MGTPSLYRLDETRWSTRIGTKEIHIVTPGFDDRSLDYNTAQEVAQGLTSEDSIKAAIKNGITGKWQITDITKTWYDSRQTSGIVPSFHPMLANPPVQIFQVSYYKTTDKVYEMFRNTKNYFFSRWITKPTPRSTGAASNLNLEQLKADFISTGAYSDPFSQLARDSLQQFETPFVADDNPAGSSVFVLRGQELKLEPNSPSVDASAKKDALNLYIQFLREAFAWRILDGEMREVLTGIKEYSKIFSGPNPDEQLFGYLKATLAIDLEKMAEQGEPLFPDHVFKCNIAVNNIEMLMVESLWLRIDRFRYQTVVDKTPLKDAQDLYNLLKGQFSLREIRGLYKDFFGSNNQPKTLGEFIACLKSLKYLPNHDDIGLGEKVRELDPDSLDRLMKILYVDTDLLDPSLLPEKVFTGRKITHLAISGYKTMGNKIVYDPSRNLFELFHLFPALRDGSLDLLNELLSLVVVKKSLWSHYPQREVDLDPGLSTEDKATKLQQEQRRVARLIPYPSCQGQKRWYYVDGLLNNGKGNFDYVLVPVSKGYVAGSTQYDDYAKREPLIKLYRSTASDLEAESSIDSLLADTNPKGVGNLDKMAGLKYEVNYFGRCTMPLWTALLITGNQESAKTEFEKTEKTVPIEKPDPKKLSTRIALLKEFIAWQLKEISNSPESTTEQANHLVEDFIAAVTLEKFTQLMLNSIQGEEWDNKKVAQDIHFVGHSLGGALAQSGLNEFGPGNSRVPLAKCNFKCFAFDTPGVTTAENSQFLNFGKDNKILLGKLGQQWEIHFQFEYKDFVPLGGDYFLGTIGYNTKDHSSWLKITARVCEPLKSATDLGVITNPTHGRRFVQAKMSDYLEMAISIDELVQMKEAWAFKGDVANHFGFPLTALGETFRKNLGGALIYPYFTLKSMLSKQIIRPRPYELDKDGVLFCVYHARGAARAYTSIFRPMMLFNNK